MIFSGGYPQIKCVFDDNTKLNEKANNKSCLNINCYLYIIMDIPLPGSDDDDEVNAKILFKMAQKTATHASGDNLQDRTF